MIKGGFQGLDISGVDLTAQSPSLPGAYAACAAANGKTVLVLTASGVVSCSVKKVSTNYVLAGITGDGKILSITVGSTDGISVSEVEIPSGEEPAEYLDTSVNISSTSSANIYTTLYDGVAILENSGSSALDDVCRIYTKTGSSQSTSSVVVALPPGAVTNTCSSCFVKKGTKLYCGTVPTGVTARFYPYKPVES